jgi:YidC/Oxa1 family membrane protein insertase
MDESRRQLVTLAVVSLLIGGAYLLTAEVWGPQGGQQSSSQTAKQASSDGAEPSGAPESSGSKSGAPESSGSKSESGADDGESERSETSRAERRANQKTATLRTEHFRATFTNRNTGLVAFKLTDERYRGEKGNPKQLLSTNKEPYLPLHPELGGIELPDDAYWDLEKISDTELRFEWSGGGFRVVRRVEAGKGPYQIWLTTRIVNESEGRRPVRLTETTFRYVRREEEGGGFIGRPSPKRSVAVCSWGDGEVERKGHDDLENEDTLRPNPHRYPPKEQRDTGVKYAGVSNTYFANVLAAHGQRAEACQMWSSGRGGTLEEPDGSLFESRLVYPRVELEAGKSTKFKTLAFVGPKERDALRSAGHGLSGLVDLGWFAFIGEYLVKLLSLIHGLVGNWGLAIILLTFVVKLVLYPLTEKSFRSMAKMRTLKPEMDRINELYKDDREGKSAALMELYRKHKINPLGGCLPTVLQMPIWLALYQSLSTNIELYHAPFLVWSDLSSSDPFYVLPVLVGGLMFFQQKITPTPMEAAQQKMMMYFMPIFLTGIMLFLPAGLCLYIVTNSALGIAQQQFIHFRLDRQGAAETSEAQAGDDGPSQQPAPSTAGAESSAPPKKGSSQPRRSKQRSAKRRQRRGRA